MKYNNYTEAVFIDRPNRFIANVEIDGKLEKVHVKNTGRCKEILIPGVNVILEKSNSPDRKTRYDLIAAYKDNFGLINIDSQAPNKVAKEWLDRQDYEYIKPEYTYGRSRIDFYMEKNGEKYLMEVKGCTLEVDGTGYFPDAPTERGVKHLRELAAAVGNGYHCIIAFVIQMEGISEVKPYTITDPEFGRTLQEAKDKGVEEVFIKCKVGKDTLIAE